MNQNNLHLPRSILKCSMNKNKHNTTYSSSTVPKRGHGKGVNPRQDLTKNSGGVCVSAWELCFEDKTGLAENSWNHLSFVLCPIILHVPRLYLWNISVYFFQPTPPPASMASPGPPTEASKQLSLVMPFYSLIHLSHRSQKQHPSRLSFTVTSSRKSSQGHCSELLQTMY